MNRKDLIIVAVLMNAGLLITLFLTSLKRDTPDSFFLSQQIQERKELTPPFPFSKEKQLQAKEAPLDLEEKKIEARKEEVPLVAGDAPPIKKEEKESSAAQPKTPFRIVAVEKGDVLEKIARHYGVSVAEIMKLNHLTDSRLQIGQELKLPGKSNGSKKKEKKNESESVYYVVKGGDSPWTIAQKHHMQVDELLKLNGIDAEKAKRLRPGDRLRIK